MHLVEVKYCEGTRPNNQLEASKQKHKELCRNLQGAKITLHTILLGVGGTIYIPHTLDQLIQLGLDTQRATKLANKLHAHSVCYAYKLTSTRRALDNKSTSHSQGLGVGSTGNPPDPH